MNRSNGEWTTLSNLIGLSYEAALEPTKWPELLKQIVLATNARSAFLRHVDSGAAQVGFFESIGYDPAFTPPTAIISSGWIPMSRH